MHLQLLNLCRNFVPDHIGTLRRADDRPEEMTSGQEIQTHKSFSG
ncbi:hypothetical protein J2T23_003234 [Pseudarthrobacter niigatensis]|uniref:Uncharacterized protein n=1 Tax=Pseudarthrobacter niigatensis TaxID=369935 RepID=A0AAJ1SW88_9MICC|nr:hypothetical protein [Pseudarthrobacter niigatensis]MDQ0267141.1 hypothetical protein [Pseudarthrobacter niigatensis]